MKLLTKQGLVLVVGLFVFATGCSRKDVIHSEFMGTYGRQPSTADFLYLASGVDFSSYDKVMVDYLVFFADRDADYRGIQADELNEVAMAFHRRVIDSLPPDFSLVNRPGPGVLRIRTALAQVGFSRPELNSVSSVFYEKKALSVRKIPENPNLILEKAVMEIEFIDSLTQKRLALVVEPCPRVDKAGRLRWEVLTETFERLAADFAKKLKIMKTR